MLSKDKQICVVIDFESLNTNFITNEYTYNKLQSYFKNLIFINCKFINEKPNLISPEIKNKLKKFKLKWPTTDSEFLSYFENKKTIIINVIPRHFAYLKIFFLLNKVKAKQVIISNIGQIQGSWSNLEDKYNLPFLNIYLNNKLCPLIITLLSNIKLIPKIEIRFYSNLSYLKSIHKSYVKNFLFKNNFLYTKKIVPVNSKFYDEYKNKKIKVGQKYIVHLDVDLNYRHKIDKRKKYDNKIINKHYFFLNDFLTRLQKQFKKKVIVSIHPKYDAKFIQNKLKKFKVIKYKTKELIQDSFIITDFGSSALLYGIILKKNIITLYSPVMKSVMKYNNNVYGSSLKLFTHDISNNISLDKNKLIKIFKKDKNKYNDFLKSRHIIDKSKPGYKTIIKHIDKLFNKM